MRKNILSLFLLLLLLKPGYSQTNTIDSLKQLLQTEKEDSSRSKLLAQLSHAYIYSKPDSALLLAQQGLTLARAAKFSFGEAWCLNVLGNALRITGNDPKALEVYLQALKKAESINYKQRIGAVLSNIGIIYTMRGDFRTSLNYYFKAKAVDESIHDNYAVISDLLNLGDGYEKLNILDSARYYTNLSYDMALKSNEPIFLGFTLNNLGNIYAKMGQGALAMEYYRSGLSYLYESKSDESICESTLGMAKLFQKAGNNDSCLYYAKLSMTMAQNGGFTLRVLYASSFLADYYKKNKNVDSGYAYMTATIAAKDSLFSQEKTRQLQSLSFDEAMRQQEIAAAKAAEEEDRRNNIQYGIIAIGVVSFMIIFLLLTNSVIVNERWIKFLGILGLILSFEFLNLFIHPHLAAITHHSPLLLLLILVIIASFLIPLHHKLEHWIINKMVMKNKRLRLAAAKKTVAELEAQVNKKKN